MERKRGHQWLTDSSNSELFSNKTRAVECADARIGMGVPQMNLSGWDNSLASGRFVPENVHNANLVTGNLPPMDGQSVEGRKDLEVQYNNASSFGFPHTVQDGSSSYSLEGIRKVKVNQVNDFTRSIHEPMTQFYGEGIPRSLDMGSSFSMNQNNPVSLGQTGSSSGKNVSFVGPIFSKAGGSSPQNFGKDGAGFMPMGSLYDKGDVNVLPTGQPSEKGRDNFVLMGQSFHKMDSNLFSVSPSYNRGQESFMSILTSYGKAAENLFSSDTSFQEQDNNLLSMGSAPYKASGGIPFMLPNQDRTDQNDVPITQQGGSNTISFGGFQNEDMLVSSGSIINGYESFGNVAENFKDPVQKRSRENLCGMFSSGHIVNPNADTIPKIKETKTTKKAPTNTFPSNVKSLLSTGMFDGVHVKYYSWSREKNLQGIIKGTGYLCGCSECKMTKVLNAYEFERHANCKTKHPNNHIYFENGKTIYAVVQELKNTPQEMLFDAIQNVTGSEINHKNFNTWKASYQAASRELQRIYGGDGVTLAS
ncbi:PREDICTED: uncharacterized protein LOC104827321 [Tarenaya hassleriana]|uniref:uncharacterized protein LOC104827321 n=1 Tax=Tarenaya hassleriana TaxID=28532 RepID=UPI00053C4E02|nr:PREDICTED: uncharacterized protein LOC104827321 [Tarenaya hassleriana]XP_010558791.1 PREDICTED: uncharacterized protein LOC104827321 [Tarenaya hassleriana]